MDVDGVVIIFGFFLIWIKFGEFWNFFICFKNRNFFFEDFFNLDWVFIIVCLEDNWCLFWDGSVEFFRGIFVCWNVFKSGEVCVEIIREDVRVNIVEFNC